MFIQDKDFYLLSDLAAELELLREQDIQMAGIRDTVNALFAHHGDPAGMNVAIDNTVGDIHAQMRYSVKVLVDTMAKISREKSTDSA